MLILKHLPEGQGPIGTIAKVEMGRVVLCLPAFFTCLAKAAGMPHPKYSPTASLKLTGKHGPHEGHPLNAWTQWSEGLVLQGPMEQ